MSSMKLYTSHFRYYEKKQIISCISLVFILPLSLNACTPARHYISRNNVVFHSGSVRIY